jgi:hypothetical protein
MLRTAALLASLLVVSFMPLRADTLNGAVGAAEEQQWISLLKAQIRPGLRRSDVEKLLPHRQPGAQPAASTWYAQDPDTLIEVPYDETGGAWTGENRVNGPILIRHIPAAALY